MYYGMYQTSSIWAPNTSRNALFKECATFLFQLASYGRPKAVKESDAFCYSCGFNIQTVHTNASRYFIQLPAALFKNTFLSLSKIVIDLNKKKKYCMWKKYPLDTLIPRYHLILLFCKVIKVIRRLINKPTFGIFSQVTSVAETRTARWPSWLPTPRSESSTSTPSRGCGRRSTTHSTLTNRCSLTVITE